MAPREHLQFVDVVRDRHAETAAPFRLPFVAVEHNVDIATLQQVGEFVPLALGEPGPHSQSFGNELGDFQFEALILSRVIVPRKDVRTASLRVRAPHQFAPFPDGR